MNDGAILLREILESPADDHLRLVYADWLEEHGNDPVRAEYIRLSVATDNRDQGCPRTRSRYRLCQRGECERCEPHHRLNEIYKPFWDEADAQLRPLGCHQVVLRRGFVRFLACSTTGFLEHGAALLAAHPVERIYLPHVRVEIFSPAKKQAAWLMHYYEGESKTLHSQNHAYGGRDEMIGRLMADIATLEAEFA